MMLCLFWGVKLLLDDLGINKKYEKAIVMAFSVIWFLVVFFFAVHLSSFYPTYVGA
jgi:hypothetical protein